MSDALQTGLVISHYTLTFFLVVFSLKNEEIGILLVRVKVHRNVQDGISKMDICKLIL